MSPDVAYLRLKSSLFYKTSVCCSPSLYEAKDFRPIGSTFGRRPLTGEGGRGSDLNGQIPLKIRKSKVNGP